MSTIKSYTDLEQSKKLAEILPLESADMHYNNASIRGVNYVDEHRAELMEYNKAIKVLSKYTINPLFEVIPCWSFAALLNILDYPQLSKDKLCSRKIGWMVSAYPNDCRYDSCWHDNPVDACVEIVEMIIRLNEQNLL